MKNFRKLVIVVILTTLLVASLFAEETTVFVTKTGTKYPISGKLAKNLKNLCRVFSHAEVCAAWSVFVNDKLDLKDREFWCKGYSPDRFINQQCFSLCQEAPGYKDLVRRHEVETFGYKPVEVKCEIKSFGG